MRVRARRRTLTVWTFTPTTPHIAQYLTAAVKPEVQVRTASFRPSIRRLPKAGGVLARGVFRCEISIVVAVAIRASALRPSGYAM